jgi:hypothetical protein
VFLLSTTLRYRTRATTRRRDDTTGGNSMDIPRSFAGISSESRSNKSERSTEQKRRKPDDTPLRAAGAPAANHFGTRAKRGSSGRRVHCHMAHGSTCI